MGMVEGQEAVERLERLTGMLRRRGVILPAFEIHGGAKGLYDFGPVGGRLRSKVQDVWRDHWLSQGDVVEVSCPTVTPFAVLEASGHVAEFSDFMTVCQSCNEASRADTMLEGHHPNPDALPMAELQTLLDDVSPSCPSCGASEWSPIVAENLMFDTVIGAGSSGRPAFLRPETAQGMFTTYPAIYRHFRERLPFGAMQLGRGYRNEISPRQGMIRLREFNMAELEYFIDPASNDVPDLSAWSQTSVQLVPAEGDAFEGTIPKALADGIILHPTVAWFMARTYDLMMSLGVLAPKVRFRQHARDEMAHYALDCWDVELHGSYGWVECVGIAHRGCYDLEAHEQATGQRLRAWRTYPEPKIVDIDGWTIDGARAGPAFRALAGQVKDKVEALASDTVFPASLVLEGGEEVTVESEHVKRVQRTESVAGEWFIPHVVEPAFGIDRIIWHLIDHAYEEVVSDDDMYVRLRLHADVAPIDAAVLPLFEKDGMGELASDLHRRLCATRGVLAVYDGSGSIGRRYARADEIGIPCCLTVDHTTLEDGTVTWRDRDTGEQMRITMDEAVTRLAQRT
jgi:glycyl-tRNA synthetase